MNFLAEVGAKILRTTIYGPLPSRSPRKKYGTYIPQYGTYIPQYGTYIPHKHWELWIYFGIMDLMKKRFHSPVNKTARWYGDFILPIEVLMNKILYHWGVVSNSANLYSNKRPPSTNGACSSTVVMIPINKHILRIILYATGGSMAKGIQKLPIPGTPSGWERRTPVFFASLIRSRKNFYNLNGVTCRYKYINHTICII